MAAEPVGAGASVRVGRAVNAEQWRPVAGYEGHYEVSDAGNVVSVKKGRHAMTPIAQASGHLGVPLCKQGVKTRHRIHRLVLAAFVGPCPEGQEVRHKDGDPTNNQLDNLVYGTVSQNKADMYDHGVRKSGSQSHLAKYSDTQIAAVMALKGVVSRNEAARRSGLSARYISQLWSGKSRKRDGSESAVEGHLVRRVKALGGEVRKLVWDGRVSAPDRLVMLPGKPALFVELKRPGLAAKFPSNAHERKQFREHARMRALGQRVEVIDSFEAVDRLLG